MAMLIWVIVLYSGAGLAPSVLLWFAAGKRYAFLQFVCALALARQRFSHEFPLLDRQTDRQTGRQTESDIQTDEQTDKQTDRQTDRQTDKQAAHKDNHTYRHTDI